ncbi:Protein CBR-KLP-11 [Caenorhabditis briggsae]|uniref:Protein CBR-KLP-11 n=2 Tax=Caenorhabditis briggsae TaxID=6238 RepID=A8WJH6_CAEBR|nr:Protein CBR-KLP-11 [Caenorhabditis briggsae]CAP20618.2 Protein CBR-KLP-11 [Caenorhabditis briggsae]
MVEIMKKSSKQETVKVIVRCRPLSSQEIANGHSKSLDAFKFRLRRFETLIVHMRPQRGQIELKNPKEQDEPTKDFTFDAIYDENSTQSDLYEETFRDLVDSVLNGYNATIFAYGQTGTGKTHTMEGKSNDSEQRGVIYKCIDHIFEHMAASHNQEYLVRASYLEIYQEELRDLLEAESSKKLEIKERPDGGVYVKDLTSKLTRSVAEIQEVMVRGNAHRSVGRTNMNEHSSRSHAIFIITVECSRIGADGESHITVGRLNLVDLAGSERQSKTGATGERFKEATKINLSLSALGNVISALVDAKSAHIPYRDSKLTRLLQDSLGGNSKTVMVACIGPASYNFEETLGTLRYANRAKNIKNQPKINEDPKDALLREFQEEIEMLKEQLSRRKLKSRGGESYYASERAKLEDDLEAIQKDDSLIKQEKDRLIREIQEKHELLEKERIEQKRVAERIANIQSRLISKNEIRDMSEAFSDERQNLQETISEIDKELRLKLLIVENFIPPDVCDRMKERAEWDENEFRWNLTAFPSTSSTPVNNVIEVNEDGILTRSTGGDSGVSLSGGNGMSSANSALDKRLVATPGCRRPMSMCERMLVERARERFSNQRRPPISGNSAYVEAQIPEETIRFCGENVVIFNALERFVPDVTDSDPATFSNMVKKYLLYFLSSLQVRTSSINRKSDNRRIKGARSDSEPPIDVYQKFKKRLSPQRHNATEQRFDETDPSLLEIGNSTTMSGLEYVDYLINKTEEMTRKLNDSTDSEGICADMGGASTSSYRNPSTSSGRGSMTSSINNSGDRMFLSTISTPRRPPTRIPALMTKSLHYPRSQSTPNQPPVGSCEQLCYPEEFENFRSEFRRRDTENLLKRSQERRQMRASSYDPRCLLALHPTSSARLSTSASASISNQFHQMTSSIHPTSSYSRLLPRRPQWVRSQPAGQIQLAESTVAMMKTSTGFYLEDSDSSDSDFLDSEIPETPTRRKNLISMRKLKERNRKKYRNPIRRLHSHAPPTTKSPESQIDFSEFLCVSSPIFYLLIAFLFRILLFFSENFF